MQTQVRVYRVRPGELDGFVREWTELVVPLRRQFGFEIPAAWASEEDDSFVWVVGHPGDLVDADRAYYASPERAGLDPDPARHILESRAFLARPVELA